VEQQEELLVKSAGEGAVWSKQQEKALLGGAAGDGAAW
jgi:hypothetical protein